MVKKARKSTEPFQFSRYATRDCSVFLPTHLPSYLPMSTYVYVRMHSYTSLLVQIHDLVNLLSFFSSLYLKEFFLSKLNDFYWIPLMFFAATTTKLRPWAKISVSTSNHQSQVTASATRQLQVTASMCSNCTNVSMKVSTSLKDVDAHTTTRSPLSSISQLIPNKGKSYDFL